MEAEFDGLLFYFITPIAQAKTVGIENQRFIQVEQLSPVDCFFFVAVVFF